MNKDNRNAQLNELYKFQYGKGNTIENIGGEYPIYGSNGKVGFTNIFNSENAPIIGHIGAYAGIVNWAQGKHYVTYNGVICKIKKDINPKFGYYTLLVSNLRSRLRGSTQPFVSYDLLNDVKVYLPKREIQDNIAKVLSDLDAKIELNNKINAELEQMAKTIYDYWFVQFDFPDAKGKPYKSAGGKMLYNEALKREIPEGWEIETLLDIANFQNGIACQKYRPDSESDSFLKVIKIKEMKEGFSSKTEKVKIDIPEKVKVYDGDILFSWSASLEVILWSGGEGGLNQHIFKVTSDKYPKSYYYFELLNYLQHFKMMAELRKTTMGHITQEHLRQSRIAIPTIEIINEIDKTLNPILDKQVLLQQENQKLSELRDWLLPMLMNGQVSVNNYELGIENDELGLAAEDGGEYKKGK